MKWRQIDEHYAVSDCCFYIVTKSIETDSHGNSLPMYLAWYRIAGVPSSDGGRASQPIGKQYTSAKRAQNACERHQTKTIVAPETTQTEPAITC